MTGQPAPSSEGFNKKAFASSFFSGGAAGICAKTAIAPFERIKLFFILTERRFSYKEAFKDAKFIFTKHGVLSFWRGNLLNILRIFPYASIQFSCYDLYRKSLVGRVPDNRPVLKKIALFWSGAFAGITGSLITYPLEFLRTRLAFQKDNFTYINLRSAVRIIYKREGFLSFYSGLSITLLGIIPYHGTGFFIFASLKQYMKKNHASWAQYPLFDFLFGAVSGISAQILSYPMDIVRKRMQAQRFYFYQGEIKEMRGALQIFKDIVKNEGVFKGLYKGITMNLIKGPISVGTVWTVKNGLNRMLDKKYDF